jgi:hypothetical protein
MLDIRQIALRELLYPLQTRLYTYLLFLGVQEQYGTVLK